MYIIHGNYVITLELSIMYTFNFYCKRKIRTFPTPIVHMVHSLIMMRNYRTTECGWLMLLAFYSLGYVLYFPARETTSSFSWICINASMNCPPVLNHYEFRRQEVFRFCKHVTPEVGKTMSYLPKSWCDGDFPDPGVQKQVQLNLHGLQSERGQTGVVA